MVASIRTMISLFQEVHIPKTCRMLMCCLTSLTISQRNSPSIGCFLLTTCRYYFLEMPYPINQASTATWISLSIETTASRTCRHTSSGSLSRVWHKADKRSRAPSIDHSGRYHWQAAAPLSSLKYWKPSRWGGVNVNSIYKTEFQLKLVKMPKRGLYFSNSFTINLNRSGIFQS